MNLKRNRLFTLFLAALMLLTTLAGGLPPSRKEA